MRTATLSLFLRVESCDEKELIPTPRMEGNSLSPVFGGEKSIPLLYVRRLAMFSIVSGAAPNFNLVGALVSSRKMQGVRSVTHNAILYMYHWKMMWKICSLLFLLHMRTRLLGYGQAQVPPHTNLKGPPASCTYDPFSISCATGATRIFLHVSHL